MRHVLKKTEKRKIDEINEIEQASPGTFKMNKTDGQDGFEQLEYSTHKGIS